MIITRIVDIATSLIVEMTNIITGMIAVSID